MKPCVVNVRSYLKQTNPAPFVYVGRMNSAHGLKRHPLSNPYKLRPGAGPDERQSCLEKYRTWLLALPDLDAQLQQLYHECQGGKLPLACWCAPFACHAGLLADLLGEFPDLEEE